MPHVSPAQRGLIFSIVVVLIATRLKFSLAIDPPRPGIRRRDLRRGKREGPGVRLRKGKKW
jgi:hypothetical protein